MSVKRSQIYNDTQRVNNNSTLFFLFICGTIDVC